MGRLAGVLAVGTAVAALLGARPARAECAEGVLAPATGEAWEEEEGGANMEDGAALCSARNDDGSGWFTFWDNEYCGRDQHMLPEDDEGWEEAEYDNLWVNNDHVCGTACRTTPADDAALLGECAGIVDYPYCARNLHPMSTADTVVAAADAFNWAAGDSAATWDARVESNAASAAKCRADSVLNAADPDKCGKTLIKTACWLAFPKCVTDDDGAPQPYKMCASACTIEKLECRQFGTYFGAHEQIEEGCMDNGDHFFPAANSEDAIAMGAATIADGLEEGDEGYCGEMCDCTGAAARPAGVGVGLAVALLALWGRLA